MLNLKKSLIFLVIILMCSITPAVAIQTENNNLGIDYNHAGDQIDFTKQLYDHLRSAIFNSFAEGNNTELTPEQEAYLGQQDDRLYIKSDAVLNNSQDFLNYMIDENYYYNPEEYQNLTPRDDLDKYTADATKMATYLSDDKGIDGMQQEQLNYSELVAYVNETYGTNVTSVDHVIVQIKDTDGYIRYMKLISINDIDIQLVSGDVSINEAKNRFNDLHSFDGTEINILVSPSDYSYNDYILRQIWDKQYSDLGTKKSRIGTGVQLLVVAVGAGGIGMATTGAYKMCNSCCKKAEAGIGEEFPDYDKIFDDQGNLGEDSPLLKKDGVKNKEYSILFGDEDLELKNGVKSFCSNCGKSFAIFLGGVSIAAICGGLLFYMNKLNAEYDRDIRNLLTYEPTNN